MAIGTWNVYFFSGTRGARGFVPGDRPDLAHLTGHRRCRPGSEAGLHRRHRGVGRLGPSGRVRLLRPPNA